MPPKVDTYRERPWPRRDCGGRGGREGGGGDEWRSNGAAAERRGAEGTEHINTHTHTHTHSHTHTQAVVPAASGVRVEYANEWVEWVRLPWGEISFKKGGEKEFSAVGIAHSEPTQWPCT